MSAKTVVACPTEGPGLEAVKEWAARWPAGRERQVDFVHVVPLRTYVGEMSVWEYPTREQFRGLHEATVGFLRREVVSQLPEAAQATANVMVLLDSEPEEAIRRYVEEQGAEQLVVATRGLHGVRGLLNASFASHMARSANCDVLIIRSKGQRASNT